MSSQNRGHATLSCLVRFAPTTHARALPLFAGAMTLNCCLGFELSAFLYDVTGLDIFNVHSRNPITSSEARYLGAMLVVYFQLAILLPFAKWRDRKNRPGARTDMVRVTDGGIALPDGPALLSWSRVASLWESEQSGAGLVVLQTTAGRFVELLFGSPADASSFFAVAQERWEQGNRRGEVGAVPVPAWALPGFELRVLGMHALTLAAMGAAFYWSGSVIGRWGDVLRVEIVAATLWVMLGWRGRIRVVGSRVVMSALGKTRILELTPPRNEPLRSQLCTHGGRMRIGSNFGLSYLVVLNPLVRRRMGEAWLALKERLCASSDTRTQKQRASAEFSKSERRKSDQVMSRLPRLFTHLG